MFFLRILQQLQQKINFLFIATNCSTNLNSLYDTRPRLCVNERFTHFFVSFSFTALCSFYNPTLLYFSNFLLFLYDTALCVFKFSSKMSAFCSDSRNHVRNENTTYCDRCSNYTEIFIGTNINVGA